jgi:hypothetical protein
MTIINLDDIDLKIKMAQAESSNPDPDIPRNYKILPDGTKVFSNRESERLFNMRIASGETFRNIHGIQQKTFIDLPKRSGSFDDGSYFNFSSKNNNGGRVRDAEIPFELKIATRTLEPGTLTQNTAAAIQDQAEAADQQMASYIAESIKNEELASGAEYSADDLTAIINERFPGVNANILNLVIKMIMIDSPDVKSRVAGTFPSFKLLVSARKPAFSKQTTTTTSQQQTIPAAPKVQVVPQQQQNQPRSVAPSNQTNNQVVSLPPEIQQKLDALSDQEKIQLEQAVTKMTVDFLPKLESSSQPVQELDLENQISQQFGISSALADIVVSVLLLYPQYKSKIVPQDESSSNSQQKSASVDVKNKSWVELRHMILQRPIS